VLNSQRRAGGGRISAVGKLVAVSVGAGLLVAAVAVPMIGAAGVVTRNAANTFNTLKVPSLGQIPSRSEILDADGNLIAYYYPKNIYRIPVGYNQIAPVMRNAIVAIEDSRFYAHGAFDLRGTLRALANDLSTSANPQGGSTLAQEYVKNALILTATSKQQQQDASEDTVARKIRELKMAAVVEHEMTKQQLLAAYLNAAYYDEQAYGIQVAAERYFSTSAAGLTLPEAALLAGLVRNPTAYNPVFNPGPATERRNTVLARMAQVGYITKAQAAAAEKLPLGLKMSTLPLQSGCLSQSAASDAFFCDYVLAVIRNNPALAAAKEMLNTTGGLKIYTTLNPQDQKAANNAVNWVAPPSSGAFNPGGNVDTEVLIQPGTGKIRAIAVDRPYGSGPGQTTVDYAAPTQYDGSTGGVQTGSSSKIFTLITALKQGVPFGFNMSVVNPSPVGPAGAEGRAVQRGQDRGQHGHDLRQRRQPAQAGPGHPPGIRRQRLVVHARLGTGLADEHGRGLRVGGRARQVLQPDCHQHHPDQQRREPAGAVRPLPPGVPRPGGRRGQLHPAGRSRLRYRGQPRHRYPGRGQDRDRQQRLLRRLRRVHPAPDRVRVGVQPGRPDHGRPDDRVPARVLPGESCVGRGRELPGPDVRRQRAGRDLADDVL